ncbi:Ig-like domain-containing protein [Cellvibrio sp. KY-GH-1]|uniref:Ig-like domain-containing protein n=1 Tax=Cellvibrio sp. KY-GH-1 TaxID=2303332 RepID=UPI00177F57E3|nr:Ig-like domain-containing protein [Cellvibrio sp. KY-GH-1]
MNVYYSPAVVDVGKNSRLYWSTANISRCELLDGTLLPLDTNGSGKGNPVIEGYTKTTSVRCYSSKGVIIRNATLTVNGTPPLPKITAFNSNSLSINRGQTATLSWSATDATSYSMDNGVVIAANATSVTVTPAQTTTYKLTATGQWGSASQTVIVVVVQPDSDGDGVPDYWEMLHQLNQTSNDALLDLDADGLTNLAEYEANTNPKSADTDADGLPDKYEINSGLNPLNANDAALDTDLDGANNLYEFYVGTLPNSASSHPLLQIVEEFKMESLPCLIDEVCYAKVYWRIKNYQSACLMLLPNAVLACGKEGFIEVPVDNSSKELQIWNTPTLGTGTLSSLVVKKQLLAFGEIVPSVMGPCEGVDPCAKSVSIRYQPSTIAGKYSEAATLWRLVDGVWKSWKVVYQGATDLTVYASLSTGHLFELRVGANDLQGELLSSYVLWKSGQQSTPALTAQLCERDSLGDKCHYDVRWNKASVGGEGTEQCLMNGNILLGCTSGSQMAVVTDRPMNLQLRVGNISTNIFADLRLSPKLTSSRKLAAKSCLAGQDGSCATVVNWSAAPAGACIYLDSKLLSCSISGSMQVQLSSASDSKIAMRVGADYLSSQELESVTVKALNGVLDVSASVCNISYPKEKCDLHVAWAVNSIDPVCIYSNDKLLSCGNTGTLDLPLSQGVYKLELRGPQGGVNKAIVTQAVNVITLPWGKISFPYSTDQSGAPVNGVSGSDVCVLQAGTQTCTIRVQGIFQRAPKNGYATLWRKVNGVWVNYFSRPVSDLFVLDLPAISESPSEFKLTWRDSYETPVSANEYLLDQVTLRAVKETPYEYLLKPSKTFCYRNNDASSCSLTVGWSTNDLRSNSLCIQLVNEVSSEVIQQVCKPTDLVVGSWKGEYQIAVGMEPVSVRMIQTSPQDVKANIRLTSIVGLKSLEVGECKRKTNTRCSVELTWQSDLPNTCIYGGESVFCSGNSGKGYAVIDIDYELSGFLELRAGDVSGDLLAKIKAVALKPKVELDFVNGARVEAGSLVQIKARITDPDQQFKSVSFYIDGQLISPTSISPESQGSWVPVLPGSYTVSAEVSDKWGNVIKSTPKVIQATPAILPDFDDVHGVSDLGDALLQGLKWTPLNHADMLVAKTPNPSKISYNKLTKFTVNRPLKILNTSDAYTNGLQAAKLIIVDAADIALNSSIEIIGEPADILLINSAASKRITCSKCAFKNAGRVTFAVAIPSTPLTAATSNIDALTSQVGGEVFVDHLRASDVVSVEFLAEVVHTSGIINTQQYTTDVNGKNFGDAIIPGVSKVVASGGVSLLHGRMDVDYTTLKVNQIRTGAAELKVDANISSGAINLIAAAPINLSGNLSTASDFKAITKYQGKVYAQPELIMIKSLAADEVSKNSIVLNSAVITDGKAELISQGNINLSSAQASISGHTLAINAVGDFKSLGNLRASRKFKLIGLNTDEPSIQLGANLVENRGNIDVTEQEIISENSWGTPKVSGTLAITSKTDVLNRFGGFIKAKLITVAAQTGRIRNGSLYAFDDPAREQEPILPVGHDTQTISTLTVLPVSDVKPYLAPAAVIQGMEIKLEANTSIENINPYMEPIKLGSDEEVHARVSRDAQAHADDVQIQALKKLILVAPKYVLNSSANLGVSEFSLLPSLIIQSPQVRNERYYSYTVLESVDETKQVEEQNSGATTTTTSSIKGVKARYGFYSPPGLIYSFAPVHMQFGTDTNNPNAGLLNNAGFVDIYSTVNLFGIGKITTLGVKLDKLAYETTSTTRTVLDECVETSYWNGYDYEPEVICEYGSYNRENKPEGQYFDPVLDNTLFAVAGRLDAPGVFFNASNHEVLKNIREQVINDYMAEQRARKYLHQVPDYCEEKVDVNLSPDGLSVVTRAYFISKAPVSCPGNSYALKKAVSELVAARVSNLPYELNSMISRYNSWKSRVAQ